ncbi:MAG: LPS-assembly protein LptD, partial [Vicinamibacterales bacterium]
MMSVSPRAILLCLGVSVLPRVAAAQIQDWDCRQGTAERIDADRIRLVREAECNGSGPNAGHQFFADEVVWNHTNGELEANGNVLVVSPTARLSAERAVFNTKTKLGTFYTASGLASLGERGAKDKSMFGTLEPDIYFHGETIEKTGPDRYVVSNGGFTTCVQPTPRWQVVTGKATINLEDYAILNHAVVRVKDVPVFYLPILYYPIQSDDRATGFLLPTYGRSTYRGQSVSNAFFWAINRSQDMTLYHDWYTKTGQGAGAEYRYAAAPGAQGFIETYWLREKETTTGSGADAIVSPSRRSYEVRAELAQPLPAGIRASARVDYFSDLTTQQLYNTDIYEASRRQRSIAASLTGAWAGVSVTGNFRRSELFHTQTDSTVNGYAPSLTANLSSRRLGALPLYIA